LEFANQLAANDDKVEIRYMVEKAMEDMSLINQEQESKVRDKVFANDTNKIQKENPK
jgi:hypothetical protein